MRFLVDECTGVRVASWLQGEGHEVFYEEARGMSDEDIIAKANREDLILTWIIHSHQDSKTQSFKK